ncbi:hypothetical protein BH10CYA1_BH10CYA1_31400 [soil metagenome]
MAFTWSEARRVFFWCIGLCFVVLTFVRPALADAPPVRIAVVPGGGSGQEQEVCDRINGQLQSNQDVALSPTNPDWYVVCNIKEMLDQNSGQIRYNGTVTTKTTAGHIISTVSLQKYNQDFSLTPGAQLNKKLVDNAVQDVIGGLTERAIGPIQQAVEVEMETRERMIKATRLGVQHKYDEAIALLRPITPETPHFSAVQALKRKLENQRDGKPAPASKAHKGAAH